LNKQKIREKDKYLVKWKEFTVELDTWEGKENLENTKKVIEEFEKEYQRDIEDRKKKKECLGEENYQEGLQQRSYLDEQIRDIIKNIGED